ncbi:hypothetical protein OG2516_17740 [Oceanicola granulosus HTCC2516]|uniref:Peptidase M20 dimerisation domain-containing protein n=1 Tax=Oceanicola granulosus (strain ATCC BAA-861 / DSM 15982 / KCTC 12143 / HTCC2516) TaxID=314256 RepID=Q2CF32_OCEGH|nr:M20/M25/M40 family metallo-hydrolase [Oceanicola granulosus]EAR51295.1 hypothetical protein OG2516_17740 [Oceanicola granulosus HTCC2516]
MVERDAPDRIVELLSALVAIPSINPAFRQPDEAGDAFGEAACAAFVADWLERAGLTVRREEVAPGRPNVVAHLPCAPGAPRMVWEAHLDTVQVTGMDDPFTPRVEGGRLHGRGAVDDKASLAMFMLAAADLAAGPPGIDLTLVAAVDEELTFTGILHHIAHAAPYDLGIAGEPTGLRIVSACKGCVRWHVDIAGRPAHSSAPERGLDALRLARGLLDRLDAHMAAHQRAHPLLGTRSLTCTRMEAGEGANTVPGHARLTFDFRTLPDQTGPEAWSEIAAVVADWQEGLPEGARVTMHAPFIDSVSMEVPGDARIVTGLGATLAARGREATPIGVAFGSDASKMTRAGTPTVIFGPGDIAQAHAQDEYVDLDQIEDGIAILTDLARQLA